MLCGEKIHTYIHTNGAHKNSTTTTMPIFIGLNIATQKTQMPQEENSARKDTELCSQANIL
jgi:hypothetical protein